LVEYRANPEARRVVVINDPQPVGSVDDIWSSGGSAAIIGIFLLLFGAFLYFGRAILLPIFAAAIIALTLGPVVKAANRRGISRSLRYSSSFCASGR
jgi:predicted PurR-regulated permease PerM